MNSQRHSLSSPSVQTSIYSGEKEALNGNVDRYNLNFAPSFNGLDIHEFGDIWSAPNLIEIFDQVHPC